MNKEKAIFTDFYELTMAQGFWKNAKHSNSTGNKAVFDYFIRKNPFQSGYTVFAGLEPFLHSLETCTYSQDDISYLDTLGIFEKDFLYYLESFRFNGDVYAMQEGDLVFPQEPIVRIHADIIEAQIIEGILLNTLNFQSLIATKAARIWRASGFGRFAEIGLRRAQGRDGALSSSRAAVIGGASYSSNTEACKILGIPPMGTMSHSWVMAHDSESSAFKSFAHLYPHNTVFLLDTYDTLASGLVHAIEAGKELAKAGRNFGVRLDSGDLDYLSREVRRTLDSQGLQKAFIVASNELDEQIIENLTLAQVPINMWGVGTSLVTGREDSAVAGVYKLAAIERDANLIPVMKVSDNPEKSSNPGIKSLWRMYDEEGAIADYLTRESEEVQPDKVYQLHHPFADWRLTNIIPVRVRQMHKKVMEAGKICTSLPRLQDITRYMKVEMGSFDHSYLRLLNPHVYKVSISTKLKELKLQLISAVLTRP